MNRLGDLDGPRHIGIRADLPKELAAGSRMGVRSLADDYGELAAYLACAFEIT
ncbi:hypothetical protein [Parafrankia discariae]|uniref:hypothetical protein n=1 Tax=Parafrankia discariae TaxID=365528 RepID=UPI0003A77A9B|nr:hypothetical protein [Parafrankia discariae]